MSTDKQSDTSPDDQIARCREYAEGQGWTVVESLVVAEAGISGASRHNRPRLLELIDRVAEWDVLLCFDFSRLARDSEDMGWIRNRLRIGKRTAVESSTGLDLFNVGSKVMGVFHEEYLVKLRADVHRGLRGKAERGLHAGGRAYGYRTVEAPGGKRLEVDRDQAATVLRIFKLRAGGDGLRTIAHALNADRIPAPRGKGWSVSALSTLVRNPIYCGEAVWNRSEWVKDHATGRRKRYERPESEWIRQQDEAWRIVSDDLWHAAQRTGEAHAAGVERDGRGRIVKATHRRARARYPLSGSLECGECGGSFFRLRSDDRYGCGWHRDRGPDVCTSALMIPRADLEERIFAALDRVLSPEVVMYAAQVALDRLRERWGGDESEAETLRLKDLDGEIQKAVDLAVTLPDLGEIKRKLEDLHAERRELQRRQTAREALTPDLDTLRPAVEAATRDLRAAFQAAPEEAQGALRALLGDHRLAVIPDAEKGYRVEGMLRLRGRPGRPGTPVDQGVAGARSDRLHTTERPLLLKMYFSS
jgi:DNA invertase Pin-like site-specific DNA recombinase